MILSSGFKFEMISLYDSGMIGKLKAFLKGWQYAISGILLSIPFICFCTGIETFLSMGSISLSSMIHAQVTSPLLWLIDFSPLTLGIFGRFLDINAEKSRKVNVKLNSTNIDLEKEIIKSQAIENHLRDMIDMYEADLNSAKLIQEFSLPEIPSLREASMAYIYKPLYSIGGDLLSITPLDNHEWSVLICDVVGHGISAALITSLVKVLSNKAHKNFGNHPKKYIEHLNHEVLNYLPDDYYLTALYCVFRFSKDNNKLIFSRAGHPHPFVYSISDKRTRVLEISGMPLGLIPEPSYHEMSVSVFPGDQVFLITDGLIEVRNKGGLLLGVPGLCDVINEAMSQNLSQRETLDLIIAKVKNYSEQDALVDDALIFSLSIY